MLKFATLIGVAVVLAAISGSAITARASQNAHPPPTGSASGDFSKAFVVLTFSPIAEHALWAANGAAIELSANSGKSWRRITPANLVGDDPGTRLTGYASLGANELWFAASSAGDAAASGGRGYAIEHSSNGGRTWSWTGIPNCNSCATMSMSFINPSRGWALGINGNLYATSDGGKRWRQIAKTTPATSALPNAVDFTSATTGWLAATPQLYHSIDGGRSWTKVDLPDASNGRAPARLGAPHFFSAKAGELPAVLSNGSTVIYTTSDGGRHWTIEPTQVSAAVDSPAWSVPPHLYASTRTLWSIWSGTRLYVTADAGKRWSVVPSPPMYSDDQPNWGFAMVTPRIGWIDASAAPCPRGRRVGNCGVPILLRTADAGRHWQTINSPKP